LENATFNDIIVALDGVRSVAGPDDGFVIFYAGHGIVHPKTKIGYWLPVDLQPGNVDRFISNRLLNRTLSRIRAGSIMVISDSCYSGAFGGNKSIHRNRNNSNFREFGQWQTRTSISSGGQEPVEDGTDQSPFTRALVDVLTQNEGIISGLQLFTVVHNLTIQVADQTPEYSVLTEAGHAGNGDILFVRSDAPGGSI
jgi:hypothetical protein